jgi:hypothetical protein
MIDSATALHTSSSPRSDALRFAGEGEGAVLRREQLSPRDRDEMFALFARYFANVRRAVFESDLAEKEWAIVLRDGAGTIEGFSTLARSHFRGATIFFSGDTIVAEQRRGKSDLARLWVRHIRDAAHGLAGNVYWFLISSGYRTYRFLPVFFREFHPRFDGGSAGLKSLLDGVAAARFGSAYDAASGIVRLPVPSPLRETCDAGLRARHDPHVDFFLRANPGHAAGDELACLVRVAEDNLTSAGARMLR